MPPEEEKKQPPKELPKKPGFDAIQVIHKDQDALTVVGVVVLDDRIELMLKKKQIVKPSGVLINPFQK